MTEQLAGLVAEAERLGSGGYRPRADTPEAEAARQLQICNACRYCEGFCAVFPAMTRRLAFPDGDVHFLANLCHNCGACLHACQYAPPHEFGLNLPRALAQVRGRTYVRHAWPAPLGRIYERQGLWISLALAIALALFFAWGAARVGGWTALLTQPLPQGQFYAVFPHGWLVGVFAPVFLWATVALGLGLRGFWRQQAPAADAQSSASAHRQLVADARAQAWRDGLSLRYLDGGHGEGCHNDSDAWTDARRRAHHLTLWGFVLCFAATSVATVYHYALGWVAPYDLPSLPKLLGVVGGVLLLVGSLGLIKLRLKRHPAHAEPSQSSMDLGLAALLALSAATGLGLWLARGAVGQGAWLAVHLGCVMALFLTLPYGKFAHGFYRLAALLKYHVERRQPDRLRLGGE